MEGVDEQGRRDGDGDVFEQRGRGEDAGGDKGVEVQDEKVGGNRGRGLGEG